MKVIPLTQGKVTVVDDEDYDQLSKYKWYSLKGRYTYYAARNEQAFPSGYVTVMMHRELLTVADRNNEVDHIDGNGLNNCKSNLREASRSQNLTNRPGHSSAGYKGVSYRKDTGKWQAFIMSSSAECTRRKINLGCYKTPEAAATAYDNKARELHGEFAHLNFPEVSHDTGKN